MDWGLVLREWPTVLGACGITWIITQYFMARSHKIALRDQHKFAHDRLIRKHVNLLAEIQRRLASELFERDPELYTSALKSMSLDVERILGEGKQAIEKRIETLEEEARLSDLLDSPGVREITSLKEEFSFTLEEELVVQYQIISTLYFLHRRSLVPEGNLNWALEKKQERRDANLRWRLKRADAEFSAFEATINRLTSQDPELGEKVNDHFLRTHPLLYQGSDFKAYFVDYLPASRHGFALENPNQHGVVEVFVGDDKTYTSIYRSDQSFENTELLQDRHDTTITYLDRTHGEDTL